MMTPRDIASLLAESHREWLADPPCGEAAIEALRESAPVELPSEYLDLLRHCNGDEGPLAIPPLWFILYEAEYAAELNAMDDQREFYPGYYSFGTNGGLERTAFDIRGTPPWPVVMFDPIAGVESAEVIAADMASSIPAIGLGSPEDESEDYY
jgi:hypothetical protein